MRLFRMLVPIAMVALVWTAATGAQPLTLSQASAIVPSPAFTPGQEQVAAGDDWLTAGGGLDDNRHSILKQINSTNVTGLKLAWTGSFNLPKAAAAVPQEGSALAYKGTLYIPNGLSAVLALDGATGKTLWYYSPKLDNPALLPAVRGVAIGDGKIYEGQTDGNVVALDQVTGNPVWKTKVGDPTDGIQFSSAPIYYNGMILEGASGGDWGGRSFAIALDAKTGQELWRWYTAPSPGSLGSGSWGINEWQRGGGAIWIYPSIDVDHGLIYMVTGNPIPWNGRGPGNNYWTDSIVALHLNTGTFAWGYQTVHHDIWDFDVTNPPVLFDIAYNGVMTPGMGVASKTGWVYILNRLTGKPVLGIPEKKVPQLKGKAAKYANLAKTQPYPVGEPFTNQCSTRKQWPTSMKAPDGKPFIVGCIFTPYAYVKGQPSFLASTPQAQGGVDWQPSAYNPTTKYLYLCSITGAGLPLGAIPNAQKTIVPGALSLGVNFGAPNPNVRDLDQLIAMDMTNNKVAWTVNQPLPAKKTTPAERCSGVMSTDGGLVFAGQTNTKQFAAFDAATGKQLWLSSALANGPSGPAMTYSANGKQYIAILAHGGTIYGFSL